MTMRFKNGALIALALLALPAAGPLTVKQQEAEAKAFLKPCHERRPDVQRGCFEQQSTFILNYVYARGGDQSSQDAVADAFSVPGLKSPSEVPYDPVQACIWRMVSASAPRAADIDSRRAFDACGSLNPFQKSVASVRAAKLYTDIVDHLVVEAPDDWQPVLVGAPPPAPPIPTRCLRILDVGGDADAPYVPPPGCPGAPKSPPSKK
jgi:hypothetical protein